MEHDEEIILSHSQRMATIEERINNQDRRITAVEEATSSMNRKFDRQGWALAGIFGGVAIQLLMEFLKH